MGAEGEEMLPEELLERCSSLLCAAGPNSGLFSTSLQQFCISQCQQTRSAGIPG